MERFTEVGQRVVVSRWGYADEIGTVQRVLLHGAAAVVVSESSRRLTGPDRTVREMVWFHQCRPLSVVSGPLSVAKTINDVHLTTDN
jgi:hypothetical protein